MRGQYRAFSLGAIALLGSVIGLTACTPKEPPPDLIKTQRQALERARAVEEVLRKQSDDQRRAIDDASR